MICYKIRMSIDDITRIEELQLVIIVDSIATYYTYTIEF